MNERIKELAIISVRGYVKDTGYCSELSINSIPDEFLQKFAELIVRECADHCDLLLNHKMSSEWSRGTHDCSKAIKKHFGVK
jgi:predicted transcriptional regulator